MVWAAFENNGAAARRREGIFRGGSFLARREIPELEARSCISSAGAVRQFSASYRPASYFLLHSTFISVRRLRAAGDSSERYTVSTGASAST